MRGAVAAFAVAVSLALLAQPGEARAQSSDDAATPPGAATSTSAPSRSPEPPPEPAGTVRLGGPIGTRIEVEVDSVRGDWETVCSAPCVTQTSRDFSYRVAGTWIKTSEGFSLRVDPGETEELRVDTAWWPLSVLGWAGVGTGTVAAAMGINLELALAAGAIGVPRPTDDPALGWIVLGAGTAVAVVGLVLVLTNKHTTVTQELVGTTQTRGPEPAQGREGAALALPAPQFARIATSTPIPSTGPVFGMRLVNLCF